MQSIAIKHYQSPYGEITLGVFNDQLCMCDWRYRKMRQAVDHRIQQKLNATMVVAEHPLMDQAVVQLEEYFAQTRKAFDIPLLLAGTDFQQSVWQALIAVPYGATCSYLTLSEQIGNKLAVRAVASANGANSLSIFIPCHRIIGSNGELTGYAGGLRVKQQLLALESDLLSVQ